jgi:putative membrane protein insertion efficiency factor
MVSQLSGTLETASAAPTAGDQPAEAVTAGRRRVGARVALALIAIYQARRADRPSPCRFWPTCSAYAAEAIDRHGLWRGSRLAIGRLLRCRPFGPHGVDLVPLEIDGRP